VGLGAQLGAQLGVQAGSSHKCQQEQGQTQKSVVMQDRPRSNPLCALRECVLSLLMKRDTESVQAIVISRTSVLNEIELSAQSVGILSDPIGEASLDRYIYLHCSIWWLKYGFPECNANISLTKVPH